MLFLTGCEPQENLADDGPKFVDEAPKTLADLNLPEPELDDLSLKITEGYEHLRPFLQQDIPPEIFEELLGDIHRDLDKKRIAAESKPGHWLFGAKIQHSEAR